MMRRPKRQENEDDLLQFQEEFMSQKSAPAAKAIRVKSEAECRKRDVVSLDKEAQDQHTSPLKKSKFKERLEAQFKAKGKDLKDTINAADLLDSHDRHITTVLSKIKERETQTPTFIQQNRFVGGFPVAPHIKKDVSSQEKAKGAKKQSLFAKQFRKQSSSLFGMLQQTPDSTKLTKPGKKEVIETSDIETSRGIESSEMSSIVTGKGLGLDCEVDERERIHQENLSLLSQMSQEEILEEQAKLSTSIDPKILAFIKSKREKTSDVNKVKEDMKIEKMEIGNDAENDDSSVSSPVDGEQKENSGFDPHEQFEIKRDLPGMEIIEDEKLQWMKEPPKALLKNEKDQSGFPARFDLDGNLASRTSEVNFDRALHHHGEDPDAPGYTLEELFHLARCNFKQQRVFALQLLARILEQYHKGTFRDHLQSCLLKQLIDAGLPFLLRWSIDENTEAIFSAAVYTLNAMLTVPCDHHALDILIFTDRGLEIPSLKPGESKIKAKQIDKNEVRDLTDPEMMEADVIRGLIQIQILPRLRYILEVCKPSEKTVNNCMSILTRIILHSTESAYEVMKCPRLIDTICSNFLPITWDEDETKEGYMPFVSAARLVRMLCLSGKSIASKLWSDFDICSRVLRYISLLNQDENCTESFIVESLNIWRICLSYGIGFSTTRDVYPLFMSLLQKFETHTSKENTDIQMALLLLCESIVQATSIKAEDSSKDSTSVGEKSVRFSGVATDDETVLIEWKMVEGIHMIISQLMKEHLLDFLSDKSGSDQRLGVLSCLLLYFSAYIDNAKFQKSLNKADLLVEAETMMNELAMKLVNSKRFCQLLSDLVLYSDLAKASESLCDEEKIANLPSYGIIIFKDGSSCLQSQSVFMLANAATKLLCSITTFQKGCLAKAYEYVTADGILEYLKAFSASSASAKVSSTAVSSSVERNLLVYILQLFNNAVSFVGFEKCDGVVLNTYHLASLKLFGILQNGEEFQARELLSSLIMQRSFFPEILDINKLSFRLNELNISANNAKEEVSNSESINRLLSLAVENMPYISGMYGTVCFRKHKKKISKAKTRYYRDVSKMESFYLQPKSGSLLPIDWVFLPIIELYHMATNVELGGEVIAQLSADSIKTLERTLLFILLLEYLRPEFFTTIPSAIRFVRILCVFLIGNDAFLESPVYQLLEAFLNLFTSDKMLEQLDFEMTFPGISSFYDLYNSLLIQFSASSFGDPMFSNFLLIPLQQKYDSKYRKSVWTSGEDFLRVFPLPIKSVSFKLGSFLDTKEEDEELLKLYLVNLSDGSARPSWCPFFYLVAVSHLNKFIFDVSDTQDFSEIRISKTRLNLLNQVIHMKNEDVKTDIIMFEKADQDIPKGFRTLRTPPTLRQIIIEKANKTRS